MNLKEVLEKASPRPWGDKKFCPMPAGDTRVMARGKPISVPYRILSEENFQLARHAVNNFESLLVALCGMTAALQEIAKYETQPRYVPEFIKSIIAKPAKIAEGTIREAEEVAECQ